jgi:hypothetical protein
MADINFVNGDEEIVGPDKKKQKTDFATYYLRWFQNFLSFFKHGLFSVFR